MQLIIKNELQGCYYIIMSYIVIAYQTHQMHLNNVLLSGIVLQPRMSVRKLVAPCEKQTSGTHTVYTHTLISYLSHKLQLMLDFILQYQIAA